jgi:glycosyltransferase involved in cell wall biosynthesis
MPKPKVSIIVVSYNQQDFIKDALDSLLDQKTDFLYEIIIGDDASTDDTPRILAEYAKNNPIIKLILRRRNLGPMKNFINTLQHSTGEYRTVRRG